MDNLSTTICIEDSGEEDEGNSSVLVIGEVPGKDVVSLPPKAESVVDITHSSKSSTPTESLLISDIADNISNNDISDNQDKLSSINGRSSVDSPIFSRASSSNEDNDQSDEDVSDPSKRSPATSQQAPPVKKRSSLPRPARGSEEAKRLKEEAKQLKELQAVQRQADRANGVGKAVSNCTTIIDEAAKNIIDPEGHTIRTLFDEASAPYRLAECSQFESSITWSYRRTEAKGMELVQTFKEADWMLIVMDGAEYLRRILLYRDDRTHRESINNYICDTMASSKVNLILLVYNLSKSLKEAKRQDERAFRRNFKDTYESNSRDGVGGTTTGNATASSTTNGSTKQQQGLTGASSIGLTDLQDLRLDLELEIKFEHPDWKLQIDFDEKKEDAVATIVRYTKSVAKCEIERRKTQQTDIDWAINADKGRAVDPLQDLTMLWEKQLMQFGQLTITIAKTITAEYPSPATLIEQYKSLNVEEGESLLAELHIGRTRKQVGPTISRRIHRFMTSRNPKLHLGID